MVVFPNRVNAEKTANERILGHPNDEIAGHGDGVGMFPPSCFVCGQHPLDVYGCCL